MNKIVELNGKEMAFISGGNVKDGISVRGWCTGLALVYSGVYSLCRLYPSDFSYRDCLIMVRNNQCSGSECIDDVQKDLNFFEAQCKDFVSPDLYEKVTGKK